MVTVSLLGLGSRMDGKATSQSDLAGLWRSGALPQFCFISLGLIFHAGAENMISTIMPSTVR